MMWLCSFALQAQLSPKREFRGAWIQCVNYQFMGLGTAEMQRTLTYQLNELQKCGINAILFQVRPEFDALDTATTEIYTLSLHDALPICVYADLRKLYVEVNNLKAA